MGTDLDEVGCLRIVHFELAVEAEGELRHDEAFERPAAGPAPEPPGDEDRLSRGRNADPLEFVGGRDQRGLPRIPGREGDRQGRGLDHDRRPASGRDERLERLAHEREPKRVANRRADVGDRFLRRRRRRDEGRMLTGRGDDKAGAVEEGNPWHRYGIER